jgi:hypothetical protein
MTYHFRVSVEGQEVERLLGELLVARAICGDLQAEVMHMDVQVAEDAGDPFVLGLVEGEPDPERAKSPWGPITDQLEPLLDSLEACLTAVIDYLRVNPD